MKTYVGMITPGQLDWFVTVDDKPLPLRLDLVNHSPDGFAWGYAGSGPAQLALALLADATGDDVYALGHYQVFARKVVESWNKDASFMVTDDFIRDWCRTNDEEFQKRRAAHFSWGPGDVEHLG
jgi:hypothetical protein